MRHLHTQQAHTLDNILCPGVSARHLCKDNRVNRRAFVCDVMQWFFKFLANLSSNTSKVQCAALCRAVPSSMDYHQNRGHLKNGGPHSSCSVALTSARHR